MSIFNLLIYANSKRVQIACAPTEFPVKQTRRICMEIVHSETMSILFDGRSTNVKTNCCAVDNAILSVDGRPVSGTDRRAKPPSISWCEQFSCEQFNRFTRTTVRYHQYIDRLKKKKSRRQFNWPVVLPVRPATFSKRRSLKIVPPAAGATRRARVCVFFSNKISLSIDRR